MPRNVEVKARIHDWERSFQVCKQLSGSSGEKILQRDVFFNTTKGRLKLRDLQVWLTVIQSLELAHFALSSVSSITVKPAIESLAYSFPLFEQNTYSLISVTVEWGKQITITHASLWIWNMFVLVIYSTLGCSTMAVFVTYEMYLLCAKIVIGSHYKEAGKLLPVEDMDLKYGCVNKVYTQKCYTFKINEKQWLQNGKNQITLFIALPIVLPLPNFL